MVAEIGHVPRVFHDLTLEATVWLAFFVFFLFFFLFYFFFCFFFFYFFFLPIQSWKIRKLLPTFIDESPRFDVGIGRR